MLQFPVGNANGGSYKLSIRIQTRIEKQKKFGQERRKTRKTLDFFD